MAKIASQAEQRRAISPRDQFGRKWGMHIEIATGDPTGGIYPAGWQDPLRTPWSRIKMVTNEDGQRELGRCTVDFPTWIAEIEQGEHDWYQQLHVNARDVYKRISPEDVANLEHDKFLLDLTGPKPWPSTEVLRRAQAGYKPFLGLESLSLEDRRELRALTLVDMKSAGAVVDEPPPEKHDDSVVPEKYADFVSWVFRTGGAPPGDMKKAAELWRAHREALQATP